MKAIVTSNVAAVAGHSSLSFASLCIPSMSNSYLSQVVVVLHRKIVDVR